MDHTTTQECILLQLVREVCSTDSSMSATVKSKVNKILAESDLTPYLSLHQYNTVDESASTALGIVQNSTTALTFNEQSELNQEIIQAIKTKLPQLFSELEAVCGNQLPSSISEGSILQKDMKAEEKLKELVEAVNNKLNILKEQEEEKVELMMRWLTFKLQDVVGYSNNSTELQAAKTKTLDVKSKILHLQILHSIFTETNQSIKAYTELQKDIQESTEQVERRLQEYKHIIHND